MYEEASAPCYVVSGNSDHVSAVLKSAIVFKVTISLLCMKHDEDLASEERSLGRV